MNIKTLSPKTQISSSKKELWYQFLLSLIATTISIVLTFGTAIWLDHSKKEESKREMVMMILYDLSNTLKEVEEADSLIQLGFQQQLAIAASPQLLEEDPYLLVLYTPLIDYTETVEQIFSSSIETINTLGNVLFAENVSEIYRIRKQYKKEICDMFEKELEHEEGLTSYEQVIKIPYANRKFLSGTLLFRMKEEFVQCQQMMDVTDEDLATYRQMRQDMEQDDETVNTSNALIKQQETDLQLLREAIQKGKQQ